MIHRPSLGYAGIVGEPDAPDPWSPGAVWEPADNWVEMHVDWGGGEAAQLQVGVVPVGGEHGSGDAGKLVLGWPRVFVGDQPRQVTGRLLTTAIEDCADSDESAAVARLGTLGIFEMDPLVHAPEAHTRAARRRRGDRPTVAAQIVGNDERPDGTTLLRLKVSNGTVDHIPLTLCGVSNAQLADWLRDPETMVVGCGLVVIPEVLPGTAEQQIADQLAPFGWHLASAAARLTAAAGRAPWHVALQGRR